MVLQVLHTGALKKFLHFISSPIVGIKLLQGEADCFGGLLGAGHPQGSLWLETYKGAPIHGHVEVDTGFRALRALGGQLAAQGASDCERNYGEGEGQLSARLRRGRAWGMFIGAKGTWKEERIVGLRTQEKSLTDKCWA